MASLELSEDVYPYGQPFSLSEIRSDFLEGKDPQEGFQGASHIATLMLLSNHITEAHVVMLAIAACNLQCDRTVPRYQPWGLDEQFEPLGEYFFQTHSDLPRPPDGSARLSTAFDLDSQWARYDDLCSHDPWLAKLIASVNHDLFDMHQWRDTHDPLILAACFAGLSKPPSKGIFPSIERMKEALLVAQKLYGQSQVNYADLTSREKEPRHGILIPRVLAIDLAIRAGDKQAAVDMLSLAVRIDDITQGVQLEEYLQINGIYGILPLLAEKGLDGNPYFICKENATLIAQELAEAMYTRVEKGPLCSLRNVGWEELMNRLADAAWAVNSKSYKRNQGLKSARDILFPPATEAQIRAAEERVGELPPDFKEMVRVSNGFKGDWHFLAGGIEGVCYPEISKGDSWVSLLNHGLKEKRDWKAPCPMIRIGPGAPCDNFEHFILPHPAWKANATYEVEKGEYVYFDFSNWAQAGTVYSSVRESIAWNVKNMELMVLRGEKHGFGENDSGDENGAVD